MGGRVIIQQYELGYDVTYDVMMTELHFASVNFILPHFKQMGLII